MRARARRAGMSIRRRKNTADSAVLFLLNLKNRASTPPAAERVTFLDSGHPALRRYRGQLRCSRRSCGAVPVQRRVTKRKHVVLRLRGAALQVWMGAKRSNPFDRRQNTRCRQATPAVLRKTDRGKLVGATRQGLYAASMNTSLPSAQPFHLREQVLLGCHARAFFLGDFFLCTSKERSYPLLRRRSGSPAIQDGSGTFTEQVANNSLSSAKCSKH
jgi:hypothetical protein